MRYQIRIENKTITVDSAELIRLVCDGHVIEHDLIIRDKDKARYWAKDLDFIAPIFNLRKKQDSSINRAAPFKYTIFIALLVLAAFAVKYFMDSQGHPEYKRRSNIIAAAKKNRPNASGRYRILDQNSICRINRQYSCNCQPEGRSSQ